MDKQHDNILFFDGVCTLCNSFVDTLMRLDKNKKLRYASLQGNTAKKLLPKDMTTNINSLVLIHQGELKTRSSASLTTFKVLGGVYSLAYIFILVPKFIRDWVYKLIAKNRYKWFGKQETCRVPTPSERERLLD